MALCGCTVFRFEELFTDLFGVVSIVSIVSRDCFHRCVLPMPMFKANVTRSSLQPGLIAPLARGKGDGGGPFVYIGGSKCPTLKTVTVWTNSWTMKAIELILSDGWSKRHLGRLEEGSDPEIFTFQPGESITSLDVWDNGIEGASQRAGKKTFPTIVFGGSKVGGVVHKLFAPRGSNHALSSSNCVPLPSI